MSAADEVLNKGERVAGQGNSTSPSGQPVPSENTSITAGPQGPNVLNDIHLIEKLAHFNRERVPERTPHAKGHGAFGERSEERRVGKECRSGWGREQPRNSEDTTAESV